jgi:LCP family protein required for cell wall assembly
VLCGSNESNTDSIMVVHADGRRKKVIIVSIPRDLFYHGRKFNMVYPYWGTDQFLKELRAITGLDIEKYIHIDMFAFIDVINIIGGIDIVLDDDLIDPSYKVKENGEWSTLCYPKGRYHFNGLQALRVARSRNVSSDFSRSLRQQKIVVGVVDKFRGLSVANLDTVYGIAATLLKYVQTNLSLVEIISYFNRFKDFTTVEQHTLDINNVLYTTYSNIYLLKEDEIPQDENFDKGAWILLPKNNDWNVIKWYIRQLIDR